MHCCWRTCCLLCVALACWAGCATPGGSAAREKRAAINQLCNETLARLYKRKPAARAEVEGASGYAVFSEFGLKALPGAGADKGYGVAVDNENGRRTFMRVAQVDAGPSFGVEKFHGVFVFGNKGTFQRFVDEGWQFRGPAQAKSADLRVYRFTDAGIVLQATVNHTRYWRDDRLNQR